MPLTSDRLPNNPLTGSELKTYLCAILRDELEMRAVPEPITIQVVQAMASGMDRDYFFNPGTAYPRVVATIQVRLHYAGQERCAFSVKPWFKVQNPLAPTHEVLVRSAGPPLTERGEGEGIEAFTMVATTENPNLIRVHYNIPINITRKAPPKPNEMFPSFETERLEYDPAEFPEPASPSVTDETEQFAAMWRVEPPVAVEAPSPAPKRKKGWNKTP